MKTRACPKCPVHDCGSIDTPPLQNLLTEQGEKPHKQGYLSPKSLKPNVISTEKPVRVELVLRAL